MIPDCLFNLVALKSCAPAAGVAPLFFIDEIQGVSFDFFAAVATNSTPTGQATADRLIKQATESVLVDIQAKVNEVFTFRDSLELILPDPWREAVLPPSALPRGLTLTRQTCCGKTACLYIESLLIAVGSDHQTLEITVADAGVLSVYTVQDVVANQPFEVPISLTTTGQRILITLPAGVQPYTLTQPYAGCGCTGASPDMRCYRISGWNGEENDGRTYGVQIRGQVKCCFENLLCIYRPQIADMVRFRAAMALAMEAHISQRVNPETLNQNALDILYENWNSEYQKRLKNWFQSARITIARLKEPCIECEKESYRYAY